MAEVFDLAAEAKRAVDALDVLVDQVPAAKLPKARPRAMTVEALLRRGISALAVLQGVRDWILDSPSLGGEESPFVKKIDQLMPRA